MNIIQVPLSDLGVAESNVRKTGGKDVSDLVASIQAHGLLQNLTVSPGVNGVKYRVIAGGRRLRALQELAKSKTIPGDWPVPCNVVDEADAAEASLTENVSRSQMHPADEFDAFAKLANGPEKASAAEIAARFGKSERYVQQRLKLANVAPELLKQYRDGKATLEQMMALALTDDQALQARIWKAARQDYNRRPDLLRRAITEKEMSASSTLAKFIGVDAYEQAGGQVRRDFFGNDEDAYLADPELAKRLALEKLERTAEKIRKEGWKWVETRLEFDYSERYSFGTIYPERKGNKDVWTDKVKQKAGAIVTIAHNGQAEIERGLVRPEDRRAAEKSGKGKVEGGRKAPKARKPGELTFASLQRLQAECGFIVAMHVASNPRIASALLAAELADKVFFNEYGGPRRWVQIERKFSGRSGRLQKEIASTAPAQAFAKLEKEWSAKLPKKRGEVRAWILEQSADTIDQLLAFLIAREIDIVDFSAGENEGIVDLVAATGTDLEKDWQPTEDWLATLPKSTVLAMVKDVGAKDIDIAKLAKLPKAELPNEAVLHFTAGWLPKPLRPAKIAAKKKSPAKKTQRA